MNRTRRRRQEKKRRCSRKRNSRESRPDNKGCKWKSSSRVFDAVKGWESCEASERGSRMCLCPQVRCGAAVHESRSVGQEAPQPQVLCGFRLAPQIQGSAFDRCAFYLIIQLHFHPLSDKSFLALLKHQTTVSPSSSSSLLLSLRATPTPRSCTWPRDLTVLGHDNNVPFIMCIVVVCGHPTALLSACFCLVGWPFHSSPPLISHLRFPAGSFSDLSSVRAGAPPLGTVQSSTQANFASH